MRQFLADASHDLRKPITGVIAGSERLLLDENLERTEREQRTLDVIRQARRAARLVDDVMLVTRLKVSQHRLDTARQGEGSGLGLPIAASIAARHGGSLECRENPAGSVFRPDAAGRRSIRRPGSGRRRSSLFLLIDHRTEVGESLQSLEGLRHPEIALQSVGVAGQEPPVPGGERACLLADPDLG